MAIFVFVLMLIAFSIVGGIIYLIYLPFKIKLKKTKKLSPKLSRKINVGYFFVILLAIFYFTYDSLFPSQSFYEEEFKTVTLREIPKSAEFIKKSASYPDFHGDYCSSSQIKLSKADYAKLLEELNHDKRIHEEVQNVSFSEFDFTLQDKRGDKITKKFKREITGEEDHYLSIQFYDDMQTVFVNVCVT